MRLKLAAVVLVCCFTGSASAETCEALLHKIDKALETSKVSSEKKDKAMRLRDQGRTEQTTGGDCEPAYLQALKILGK